MSKWDTIKDLFRACKPTVFQQAESVMRYAVRYTSLARMDQLTDEEFDRIVNLFLLLSDQLTKHKLKRLKGNGWYVVEGRHEP